MFVRTRLIVTRNKIKGLQTDRRRQDERSAAVRESLSHYTEAPAAKSQNALASEREETSVLTGWISALWATVKAVELVSAAATLRRADLIIGYTAGENVRGSR